MASFLTLRNVVANQSTMNVTSLSAATASYSTLLGSTISNNTMTVRSTISASTITTTGNVGIGTLTASAPLHIHTSGTTSYDTPLLMLQPQMANNYGNFLVIGKINNSAYNSAQIGYIHSSDGSVNNYGCLQLSGVGNILNWTGNNRVGIGITNPANKFDIQTEARSNTHNTNRGLYVTSNCSAVSDGAAEFRHSNGTQGVGIGYNGIYATGSSTNQDLQLASRGSGTINLLNDTLASGYIKQNGSGKIFCFVTDTTTSFSSWFAFGSTAQANFGSCFNTSTRRFTAPVNGVYLFSFYGYGINEGHVGMAFNTDFPDNSLYYTTQQWSIGPSNSAQGTWIMYLNANDYVRCILYNSGNLATQRSYFTGTLVHAYN